jgi:ABC-type transporter lipoprotein component MlaA
LSDSLFINKNKALDTLEKYFKKRMTILLQPRQYIEQKQKIGKMFDAAENNFLRENNDFKVKNDKFTAELLRYRTATKSANERMLNSLEHDIFIRETYKITRDLIYSQK